MKNLLGLKRGIVELIPYQSQWQDDFEKEKKHLLNLLNIKIPIEHVGSTAIKGQLAKPIIDIILGVTSEIQIKSICKILSENGYVVRDNAVQGEILFVKGDESLRTHHLHIIKKDSIIWNNYLLFRESLRKNSNLLEEYNNLKIVLAKKYPTNREEYTNGKAEFITKVLSGNFSTCEE